MSSNQKLPYLPSLAVNIDPIYKADIKKLIADKLKKKSILLLSL